MKSLILGVAVAVAFLSSVAVSQDNPGKVSDVRRDPPTLSLPADAPISLSDPDGQELILEELSIRSAVHGMLSLTEMEMRFRNPQNKVAEGRFNCVLPVGATISRFAKEVNGALMEGEVVERLRANQIYDQILHQMRDPALLEQDQGNRFSARIFPIGANETVRIVLSYTTLLPLEAGQRTYSVPLRGLPQVGQFRFRGIFFPLPDETADVASSSFSTPSNGATSTANIFTLDRSNYQPDRDITISWRPTHSAAAMRILRSGDYYVASYRPPVASVDKSMDGRPWTFYVDTSASAAEGAQHRVEALRGVLSGLPMQSKVEVLAFDQSIVPLVSGSAGEVSLRISDLLTSRGFLGGTDLSAVLAHIRSRADASSRRFVLVSDGVDTLGSPSSVDLIASLRQFPKHTVHALVLGSREDRAFLRALTSGRGRIVRVPFSEGMSQRSAEAAAALARTLGPSIELADPSAEWSFPSRVEDVRSDSEVLVLGRLRGGVEPSLRALGASAGRPEITALPMSSFSALLEREAFRAYLENLAEREAGENDAGIRRAIAAEQVRVSIERRIVIPSTTMLVLETEQDYQRFGLDRRALADILTIDAAGITTVDRTPPGQRPIAVGKMRVERGQVGAASARDANAVEAQASPTEGLEVPESGASDQVAEAITVTGSAPAMRESTLGGVVSSPAPAPASPPVPPRMADDEARRRDSGQRRVVEKDRDVTWTKTQRPSTADADRLMAELKDDPRDRRLYNQLGEVLMALGQWSRARELARQWQQYDPDNPQVYEVLGEAARNLGNEEEAARAFGSLVEVAPAKPELLQRAGILLMRAGEMKLAETPLRRAVDLRPDRVNGYRHLALVLFQQKRFEEAARVLESALGRQFPDWYGNAHRVLREELGFVYRGWGVRDTGRRHEIVERARLNGVEMPRTDALRITLAWETDANDVDLHVVDPAGEECFYGHNRTASGLELYEDITRGFGPEVIRTERARRGTYHIGVKYFSAGPMGISRGMVIVMRDTGNEEEPAVSVHPFRLTEGGGDIRHIAAVEIR
jgi:Flp pilus assembly protein TadD